MMKRTLIIIAVVFLAFNAFSQNWDTPEYEKGKKYKGYVVLNNGDTLHGLLQAQYPADLNSNNRVSVMLSNQTSCLFFDENGKATRYKPKELKSYMLAGRHYVSIEYSGNPIGKSKSFVLRTMQGKISKFIFYACKPDLVITDPKEGESLTDYYNRIYATKTVYYREGAEPLDNESMALGFKKKMAALVSDNEELAGKVSKKEKGYRMMNVEKIIEEYNSGN